MPPLIASRRRAQALAAALAACCVLAGAAAAAEPVRIGVLKLASSGPVFIADADGYFAAAGLAPTLVYFDAAQPVAVAAVSGAIDVGVTGLTAGFYNLAGKGELRIIGAQSREEKGYHLIAYLASDRAYDAGLTRLADLPGHSVAVTQVGSTFHYSLGLLAEKLNFPLERLRIVPLQSMSAEASALTGNQVDAALLPGTVATPLVTRGAAHLLGWVGDETPWQLGAVFAARKTIASRRAVLVAFLAAYQKGVRAYYDAFLAKNPDGTAKEGAKTAALLAIIARYTGQKPALVKTAIPYVDPQGRLLVGDIYHQVAWYERHGLVPKDVKPASVIDHSLVVPDR
jgi:NitT/TauT family transport system substrate-binding protein